ncbi:trypsin-like [Periplaneta americana]|uniref:trypsin-like n=1 Tax=Periplaneta americana TaxID=6978 RepID=UPI0037E821ED
MSKRYQICCQVQVAVFVTCENSALCGACIISPKHVIASAHCINRSCTSTPIDPDVLTVMAGEKDLFEESNAQWRTVVSVNFSETNPTSAGLPHSDFAMIKISSPFWISRRVKPISTSLQKFQGRKVCYLIGWKRSKDIHEKHSGFVVEIVDILLMDTKSCETEYPTKNSSFVDNACGQPENPGENRTSLKWDDSLVICDDILAGVVQEGNGIPVIVADLGSCSHWLKNFVEVDSKRSLQPSLPLTTDTSPSPNQWFYLCNLFLSVALWSVCVLCVLQ